MRYRVWYIFSLCFLFAALILEALPYGVVLKYGTPTGDFIPREFSYFSLVPPFGGGFFFPILTGILTCVSIILCAVCLVKHLKHNSLPVFPWRWILMAFVFAVFSIFSFRYSTTTVLGYWISGLLLLAELSLIVIKFRLPDRKKGQNHPAE